MSQILEMFQQDLERKARILEEAYRDNVIDCEDFKVIRAVDRSNGVEAWPTLENATQTFIRTINFLERIKGICINTLLYRRRMEEQGITLNYNFV